MAEPTPSGPGKTAPRLLHDLLDYDPRRVRKPKDVQNLLADNAPIYRNAKAQPRTYPNDCRHDLMIEEDRSLIPQINEIPDRLTKYTIVTHCPKCLYHFDIIMDFSGMPAGGASCGLTTDNDLHHFRHVSLKTSTVPDSNNAEKINTFREIHRFKCSTVICGATAEIQIKAPRLQRPHLSLIADPAKVHQRGRKAIEAEPVRYDKGEPLNPSQVLTLLRQYLSDAISRKPTEVRRIAKRNKKFLMAFANDCDAMLRYLDFTSIEEATPEGEMIEYWVLPNNDTEERRAFLKDCVIELSQLVHDRPAKEQMDGRLRTPYAPVPARRHIERALGFWDYERKSRVIDVGDSPKEPYYASLGALSDFNDQLLLYSWIRQRDCDPMNRPYYLDCLTEIYNERASDQLQEAILMAQSTGEIGYNECITAFNFFGLSIDDQPEEDEQIITMYRDKISNTPRQKDEAKKCLKTVGWARNSNKIIRVSEETTMTPEDAYNFLSLGGETMNANTPSESIEAQAIAKALDIGDGGKEDVVKALLVLAEAHGNDFVLRNAASTMSPDQTGVNIDEAKRLLHVKDEMTDDTVWTYYCSLKAEAGGAIGTQEKLYSALETIANQRNSQYLMAKLKDPDSNPPVQRATAAQPVGLQNIGNTCYLNSLLQYYYTVKAIREVVMNFDEHRMPMTSENISKKRVGGRAVTQSEVLKAQQFVEELRSLYQALKTVSTTYVKPTDDLAILTLFSATAEANFRRQSVSSPVLLSGKPAALEDVAPPEGPPPSKVSANGEDIEMVDHPLEKVREEADDASSDATLVDSAETGPQLVENLPPPYPMPKPRNPSNAVDAEDEKMDDAVMINVQDLPTPPPDEHISAPERPPPVPPRNKPSDIKTTIDSDKSSREQMLKFGAQQDVTEVIGNVMFRLQCAIKPTSIDPVFGGQIDSITDTFYGSNAVYLKRASGYGVKVEPWANITVFPGKDGPRNIYEALDVHFDEQTVEIDNTTTTQFTSIRKLPPILQIQIQRTDFDRVRGAHKNQNWVSFEETIFLDRYLEPKEGETTLNQRRQEAWEWKAQLRKMEARQKLLKGTAADISVPDALTATKSFLEGLIIDDPEFFDVKPETLDALSTRSEEIKSELEYLDKTISELKAKLDQQFIDMTQHKFTLQAVFIHRGGLASGHYWIAIYDFTKRIWREYNDEHVSELKDPDRLFKEPLQRTERDATPYYLVYVRDEDKNDLVDAVCRDVQEVEEVQEELPPNTNDQQQDEAIAIDDSDDDDNNAHVEHVAPPMVREIRSAADREAPEKFPEFDSNSTSTWQ